MANTLVYEGTPAQLIERIRRLPDSTTYKMTVTPEAPLGVAPNRRALDMLRDIAHMKENMRATDPEETDRLLREARSGAMYGNDRTE